MRNISTKKHKTGKIISKMVIMLSAVWIAGQFFIVNSYATLAQDKVVTGTKNLLKDMVPVMQGIGAAVCAALAVYFFIRKANADEQDQKMWKNRIAITIISAIGIVVVGGIITTVVSYYK